MVKKLIVILAVMCILVGCSEENSYSLTEKNETTEYWNEDQTEQVTETYSEAENSDVYYIYVCGAVNSPGVYELSPGSRVFDAIDMAGGMTDDADAASVNLVETLADAEKLYIPVVGESASSATASKAADQLININTATNEELQELPGIGEGRADAIISYREENGFFKSTEDIMNVSGIGESLYSRIKDKITI